MAFEEWVDGILSREGGYIQDPDDPGGETRFGISKRGYPNLDIRELTREAALEIYRTDFWIRGKVERLPPGLQEIYFDMAVNLGISGAVRILQRAANAKRKKPIPVDGVLGPKTLAAVKNLDADRLRAYRVLRYAEIVLREKRMEKYWVGWYRRALEV